MSESDTDNINNICY